MAVGVKALIDMPREVIDERFGLVRDQGFANEFVGCTGGVRGGGFLYTNYDSLSVGLVFHLASLRTSGKTPYDLLNEFLEQPAGGQAGAGRAAAGVLGPPDPRRRLQHDSANWSATASW